MSLTVSVMQGGSNNHVTTSEEANGIATDFVTEGVIGSYTNTSGVAPATGAFAVNAQGTPDMTVAVTSGIAYVTGTPSSQNSQTFRVYSSASENVTISANSSGSTKYDWVYIKLDATLLANPTLAGTTTATLVTSRSTSSSTDDGTPPTYGYPIAVVTVVNGATSIANSAIRDIRNNAVIGAAASNSTGWTPSALPAVSSVTNNGNRSYDVTFASTVASLLSPGMKLRTTRTVTASTQCADLESSSSQYFNDTTVSGITFVDDFVAGAWVKLESYTNSNIISRYNGTSGWKMQITSEGRVQIVGFNAGAANYSLAVSYQSVPLGKWVHVAAQLDMSAFTTSSTASYVMIDGVDVPCAVSRSGTNPTALVQAGNLEVGSTNAGTEPFDGKISNVFVSSAKITQANIRALMTRDLTASDTTTYSLASAYTLNNSLTDLNTTSANNLTAQNGATATNADSPFGQDGSGVTAGTTDYALVMKVSTTTATVQVPEGCTIPTSGGVTSVAYSTTANPYGWVADKGRWTVRSKYVARTSKTSPTTNVAYNNGDQITVPVGAWNAGYRVTLYGGCTASVTQSTYADLNTTTATVTTNSDFATSQYANSQQEQATTVSVSSALTLSSQTVYFLNVKLISGGVLSTVGFLHDFTAGEIYAIPAGI